MMLIDERKSWAKEGELHIACEILHYYCYHLKCRFCAPCASMELNKYVLLMKQKKAYLPGTGVILDQEGGSPEQRPTIALR
ncbi:hypothetical protein TNIN_409021 [Trichonephila inaurata madagascariensis]|uniref:Uncharacterized protein n=1 Tax=Trichonephila inaurata madagascariensis TaxID=2747483 RepID=A0A8X6KFD9_9ARAC|nr:hypothetical protein TNIN_409021 [Trichonephila inaurata madagascariensis]